MWLLNTKYLQLEEFLSEVGVRYAILSHRWEREEVSFADIQSLNHARRKQGFAKIANFCKIAASKGYKYGWVDTCCIDKKSSAELSEAINSMFRWYQNAAVCYVYLSDVRYASNSVDFVRSKWFERGWTLQELLAPENVTFFDYKWKKLGDKITLIHKIEFACGINKQALYGSPLGEFSIAERMSWASNRKTTRPEDVAYSLLGIFNVNMPMLYGEGNKAFIRLQEQIMKDSDDRTIFAWSVFTKKASGLLATSPSCFKKINDVTLPIELGTGLGNKTLQPHVLTSRGVSIETELYPLTYRICSAWLCNTIESASPEMVRQIGKKFKIFLRKLPESGRFERVAYHGSAAFFTSWEGPDMVTIAMNRQPIPRPSVTKTINVRQTPDYVSRSFDTGYPLSARPLENSPLFKISVPSDIRVADVDSLGKWYTEDQKLEINPTGFGTAGILNFVASTKRAFPRDDYPRLMLLGVDIDFEPVCIVANAKGLKKFSLHSFKPRLSNLQDISMMDVDDITCLETLGWSKLSNVCEVENRWGRWASEVENRPGLWAVKVSHDSGFRVFLENSDWVLSVGMKPLPNSLRWNITVELSTHRLR